MWLRGDKMIVKVVLVESGFIVIYASGYTKLFSCPYKKLPKTIQRFLNEHTQRVERYGDQINAIVWR